MTESLNVDFRHLLDCLRSEGAEFLIVGAYAVAFHGTPRATGDLDVFVRPTVDNAARVWRALARFGAPLQKRGVAESDFAAPGMICQIGLRRDASISRPRSAAYRSMRHGHPAQRRRWMASRSRSLDATPLIENKRASGRDKDLLDVRILQSSLGTADD